MIIKAHSFSLTRLFSPNYFSTSYSEIGYRSRSWTTETLNGYWSNNWRRIIKSGQSRIGARDLGRSMNWRSSR